MVSILHLKPVYTIMDDFYLFEGSFIHLWEFSHMRAQHSSFVFYHVFYKLVNSFDVIINS